MYTDVHHLAVAVNNLKEAVEDYEKLGFKAERVGRETSGGSRQALLYFGDSGSYIELLEPMSPDIPLARTIQRRGEGIHLVALEVDDVKKAVAEMKARGVQLIVDNNAGTLVHPKSTHGVLYRLVERK
ncbi:MAG: VOC family protein [Dehalococcoidia bacterium]|nr:VOC family protein [Dehalococcoidia bacterium]